ncbi:carboxypeptidase 2 [Teratosphaeria destructans]|uniref:Carboxypeptidase 2 n=1 Tax=Teratosphaeria destructans TaxID=418781 RepID=A0A9W7SKN4_9PEZI|nr:carboxypeptidase 2 [Teratosphaeria destructans]
MRIVLRLLCCLGIAGTHAFTTKRQFPAEPQGVKTITSPSGATIRYKIPSDEGVCETTPDVKSYSGYISLDATTNMFFWFFEARHDAAHAPLTLWLNGGPGSDSMIGLFEELGPCTVTKNLTTQLNPYSWNNVTNLLFLSQPVGVGFSYETKEEGYYNSSTGEFFEVTDPKKTGDGPGRFSLVGKDGVNTTMRAAVVTWEILQAFLEELDTLDNKVQSKVFNFLSESYGGHYAPTFYRYFYEQNLKIADGSIPGVELNMGSVGLVNALVDSKVQTPYYPKFARYNTYGIEGVNQSIYDFMVLAYNIPAGCRTYLDICEESDHDEEVCSFATQICRGLVEGPWYRYSGRGTYDIRKGSYLPSSSWIKYLNTPTVQNALGVDVNYTSKSNRRIQSAFYSTGDYVFTTFKRDLEEILNKGVRVAMLYGDADYICNWFGGEAMSLALDYKHAKEFRAAGYAPFTVDGVQYGDVREYGNFSFTRMWDAGHLVPYYQPKASLEFLTRLLNNVILSDGSQTVTEDYSSPGPSESTHKNKDGVASTKDATTPDGGPPDWRPSCPPMLFWGSQTESEFVRAPSKLSGKMKRFTNLLRSKSHDATNGSASSDAASNSGYDSTNAPVDSPEANAGRAIRLFCESGSTSNGGEEVLHLPVIVEAAESSPVAAAGAAQQIRRFLTKEWSQKPHVQYNAIMLIRILCDNPGATFTRNFDKQFVGTVKECLRNCKDQSVQQILRETLDNVEVQKTHDEGCRLLLAMWKKEKGEGAHLSQGARAGPYAWQARQEPYMTAPPDFSYERVYSNGSGQSARGSGRRGALPSAAELASRIEEAKNTAKILLQLLQSTPPEDVINNELIKEFSERCQSAQKSMQNYISCNDPAPDDDTLQTLIETNEQLSLAMSRYQRAILAARRATGVTPSPTRPANAPAVQEPQQHAYGTSGLSQNALPSAPPSEQNGHFAPPGPPANMLNPFQKRESQAFSQSSAVPQHSQPATHNRTSTYKPTPPPQRNVLPEIQTSNPFADPVEHEGNPAPIIAVHQQQNPMQSFSTNPEPSYAPPRSLERRPTMDLENAYSTSSTNPVSPQHSPDLSRDLDNASPQRPSLGPYHTSGVTSSYIGRQSSAVKGLTMHGAEPDEAVSVINSRGREGRTQVADKEGDDGDSLYEDSPVERKKGFRRSLLGGHHHHGH